MCCPPDVVPPSHSSGSISASSFYAELVIGSRFGIRKNTPSRPLMTKKKSPRFLISSNLQIIVFCHEPSSASLPETNSKFALENGWLGDDPFFLGLDLFLGAKCCVFGSVFGSVMTKNTGWVQDIRQ